MIVSNLLIHVVLWYEWVDDDVLYMHIYNLIGGTKILAQGTTPLTCTPFFKWRGVAWVVTMWGYVTVMWLYITEKYYHLASDNTLASRPGRLKYGLVPIGMCN